MTPAERNFWVRVNRRASMLTPEVAKQMLLAFRILREQLSIEEMTRLIESGKLDALFRTTLAPEVIDRAFNPTRDKIRTGIADGARYFARDVPRAGMSGTVTFAFDMLNPRVIDAIRKLEASVLPKLESDVRETVLAHVEQGLRDGVSPRNIARGIRDVIGLGPSQLQEVQNFRDALLGQNGRQWSDYTLRDRRYDTTIKRLLGKDGSGLSAEQVQRMVDAYTKRRIAQNAESVARDVSLKALKLGQRLSVENAVTQGVYDESRLIKQRIGVNDSRERPSHVAMNNQVRAFNEPYSNGEMYCGELDWGCRCVDRYSQQKSQAAAA